MNRQAHERAGRRAETLACWYLRLKGYSIVSRRVKTPKGEIDVVAQRGQTLAIVEVKARQSLELAEAAIGPRDRNRITDATRIFISRTPSVQNLALRFDAVFVLPRFKIIHHPDFWREN